MMFNPKVLATSVISLAVFSFGALALILPSGYSYGALLLLLPSLIYLAKPPVLHPRDKYLILALLSYFLVGLVANLYHHLPHSSYDNLSRFLLIVPVILMLLRVPVRPEFFWVGLAVGCVGAFGLALWNFYYQGSDRAGGFTNAIQFGDIVILFSCLLLASLSWIWRKSRGLFFLLTVGIIAGFGASLFSGTRGGWLVVPFVIAVFYWCGHYRSYKNSLILMVLFVILAVCIYYVPALDFLRERFTDVFLELNSYEKNKDVSTAIGSRLHMWRASLDMIAQRPWTGWGSLENYLQLTGSKDEVLASFNHVHNDFLDAWVKRGLAGALALLGIYVVPALVFYREFKQVSGAGAAAALAGVILVVVTLVCGLTQTFFSHSSGVTVYVFLLAILWSQVRQLEPADDTKNYRKVQQKRR